MLEEHADILFSENYYALRDTSLTPKDFVSFIGLLKKLHVPLNENFDNYEKNSSLNKA